jgi:hypothetical protein
MRLTHIEVDFVKRSKNCPLSDEAKSLWCKSWNCSRWTTCKQRQQELKDGE